MRLHQLKKFLKDWYSVNKNYLSEQNKNLKTGKKKLDFNEKLLSKMFNEYEPVFFLSTGRCGTQYIANILQKADGLDVFHHAYPELIFLQKMAYSNPTGSDTKMVILAARQELLYESYRRNRIFVETNNRLTFYSYALFHLLPKAKFIHITRHPADFIISGIRRNWYTETSELDAGRIIPKEKSFNWSALTQIEKISWLWNTTNQFIEDFKSQIPSNQILSLRSEDLFNNIKTLNILFDFIGEKPEYKRISTLISKKINAQKKGDYTSYDNWTYSEKTQLKKYISLNQKYNYNF